MAAPYPEEARLAALSAITDDAASLDEAAAVVEGMTGRRPSRGTVSSWAKAAGIDVAAIARQRDPNLQTSDARTAKAARAAAERDELVELVRGPISLATAKLLASRLARAEEDDALVAEARKRWHDALLVEAQAADFGPDAVKAAKVASGRAKVDVLVAEGAIPDTNELALILNRSVRTLLALTGEAREVDAEEGADALTVVLSAPRPARGPITVVQLPQEQTA